MRRCRIALLIALLTACSGDNEVVDTPQVGADGDLAFSIQVIEGGERRSATIVCGQPIRGTGYLAELNYSGPACITAVVDPQVAMFLVSGEEPDLEASCEGKPPETDLAGARATIQVTTTSGATETRELIVEDRCDEVRWIDMSPVLQPERKAKVDAG